MYADQIASGIFSDLDSPSNLSVISISSWVRNNIGTLNNYIFTDFVTPTGGVDQIYSSGTPTIYLEEREGSILKQMYSVKYFERMMQSNLGAASVSVLMELESDGGKIKTVNKNELSKTWLSAKKEAQTELKDLIHYYKMNKSLPRGISGEEGSTLL